MIVPNRIDGLIKRIEAGDAVTQEDVDRIATLQALDIVNAGRAFVEEQIAVDREQSVALESVA